MALIESVRRDIEIFLENNGKLFFNERDLQIHLAVWLMKSPNAYDGVEVEYYVPYEVLGESYVWQSHLYLDIVVEKEGEYLPIELKYKTKSLPGNKDKRQSLLRFGEELDVEATGILKNQSAQDLGMYHFWKDVRRVELVRGRFQRVKNGLAVFVTNDKAYRSKLKETTNHYRFGMNAGVSHEKQKCWLDPQRKSALDYCNFEVEKEYRIEWHSTTVEGTELNYCILNI